MADDACNDVKEDLEAGTYTNYTTKFPTYIENQDLFEGGNVYILLKDGTRDPIQTVDGTVLYTPRSCMLNIMANTVANRDNLYLDVVEILTSGVRGYTLKRGRDQPNDADHLSLSILVSFLL